MKRWVHATGYVHGRPETVRRMLLDEHVCLLERATGSPTAGRSADGSFLLRLRSSLWSREFGKRVRITVGVATQSGERVVLPVTWQAEPARLLFPRFDGALELEPVSSFASLLTLTGSYEPPLGTVGAMVDVTLLRDRAEQTAQDLLALLSQELVSTVDHAPAHGDVHAASDGMEAGPMRVRDVMTADVRVVDVTASLRTAAAVLFFAGISGAPVVGDDGELVGVISEQDLLAKQAPPAHGIGRRVAEQQRRHYARTAADACSAPAVVITPDGSLRDAARMMLEHNVARLVVTEHGGVAGIVTRHDVLAGLLRADDLMEAAIDRMLRDRNAPDVTAGVTDGVVTLTGSVQLRSAAAALPRMISEVDGVLSVETNLQWRIDDCAPLARTPML